MTVNGNFVHYSYSSKLVLNLIESSALVIFAFLLFAIALRHKRRGKSKLASDILMDLMKVRNEPSSSEKDDPKGIILRLHGWHSDIDNERQVVSDYKDYQKMDDFYSAAVCFVSHHVLSETRTIILGR
jgi:hypothetical protein